MFALFLVFGLSAVIQISFYAYFYIKTVFYRHPDGNSEKPPVSVIVCARNEENNLRDFLPSVLEQDYPDYEVIVVNDCSEDESFNVLGEYLARYPHLRISTINKDPKFTHNKKFAQFIGIKAAKNDLLLFTDADCKPVSSQWISLMASHLDEKTDFVLGYGGYLTGKGLLNRYIRYDTVFIAVQYLGMALRGIPYMGVGRNLGYKKSLFFRNKGFGSHNHLVSGDDDLFVNNIATRENTAVEFRPESITRSVPASTIKEWLKQKRRHMTTARYYSFSSKSLLLLEPFSRLVMYTTFIILMANLNMWPLVSAIFLLRMILQLIVLLRTRKILNEPGLVLLVILFFDIFSPLINGVIYLSNPGKKPDRLLWK